VLRKTYVSSARAPLAASARQNSQGDGVGLRSGPHRSRAWRRPFAALARHYETKRRKFPGPN